MLLFGCQTLKTGAHQLVSRQAGAISQASIVDPLLKIPKRDANLGRSGVVMCNAALYLYVFFAD